MSDAQERLKEIKVRYEAATPGPWKSALSNIDALPDEHRTIMAFTPDGYDDLDYINQVHGDLDFIAHSRSDVPWLVALVDTLRSENDSYLEEIVELQSRCEGGGDELCDE